MRKKLSFKGILLGALVDVGGSNIAGIFLVIYLVSHYHLYTLPSSQFSSHMQDAIMHDPVSFWFSLIIGGGFSVLGGYVAARIAKHNELLNGTLASFLCVIASVSAIGQATPLEVFIGIVGNPLLALGGGYLRLKQVHNTSPKSTKKKKRK